MSNEIQNAYRRTKQFVQEHPKITIAVIGGVVGYRIGYGRGANILGQAFKRDTKKLLEEVGVTRQLVELNSMEMTDFFTSMSIRFSQQSKPEIVATALEDSLRFIRENDMAAEWAEYLAEQGRI
jgi:hypothetical protein